MSLAFRCEVCDGAPGWRLERRGDAVVSWACSSHLAEVCRGLQRDHEITELMITDQVKRREWTELRVSLKAIADDWQP